MFVYRCVCVSRVYCVYTHTYIRMYVYAVSLACVRSVSCVCMSVYIYMCSNQDGISCLFGIFHEPKTYFLLVNLDNQLLIRLRLGLLLRRDLLCRRSIYDVEPCNTCKSKLVHEVTLQRGG